MTFIYVPFFYDVLKCHNRKPLTRISLQLTADTSVYLGPKKVESFCLRVTSQFGAFLCLSLVYRVCRCIFRESHVFSGSEGLEEVPASNTTQFKRIPRTCFVISHPFSLLCPSSLPCSISTSLLPRPPQKGGSCGSLGHCEDQTTS